MSDKAPELDDRILENARPVSVIEDHEHTGFDVSRVGWDNLARRKHYVHWAIFGDNATTTGNYAVFFIVPFQCVLTKFQEVHSVAGTNGSPVTLMLEKLTLVQASGAGVNMLASTLSLKATANTVQTATLTATLANRNLAIGDRLCLVDAGVLSSLSNVVVSVELTLP